VRNDNEGFCLARNDEVDFHSQNHQRDVIPELLMVFASWKW